MSEIDIACGWAMAMANDDAHGYDQGSRWGPDYDCSSLVISAWRQALVPLTSTNTGNMRPDMLSHGFRDVTAEVDLNTGAGLQKGDVLLHEAKHTALYIGEGRIVNAGGNELGGVTGGQTGDQTGREIRVCPYYNFPWEYVLRYGSPIAAEGGTSSKGEAYYTVKSGDSLWSIAERELGNGYLYEDLRRINGLNGYVIYPGQVLKLPGAAEPEVTRTITLKERVWEKIEREATGRGISPAKLIEEKFA